MLFLLDTTVLIDYLRGRPVVKRVQAMQTSGDIPCTTAVNAEEVYRGLHERERDAADRLFAGLFIVPLELAEGRRAGGWRSHYAGRGVTLTQADCLVAAAAASVGAVLATGNPRDFPMRELEVEHWPVGR